MGFDKVEVRVLQTGESFSRCLDIRREVFVREQGVAETIEVDGRDGDCTHLLATIAGEAVGTLRFRIVDHVPKVERVAVLAAFRDRRIGAAMMDAVESHLANLGYDRIKLSAQQAVVPFYERRGYMASGPEFREADIPHRYMELSLRTPRAK